MWSSDRWRIASICILCLLQSLRIRLHKVLGCTARKQVFGRRRWPIQIINNFQHWTQMQTYSILFLFLNSQLSESANFLVYCPLYAHSHHIFLANLAESLTVAGHNVTFLAPIIARKYEKVKYLEHTKDLVYIQPDKELEELGKLMDSGDFSKFWTLETGVFSMFPAIRLFYKMFSKVHDNLKKDLTPLDALKNRKFDAIIYEVTSFNAIGEYSLTKYNNNCFYSKQFCWWVYLVIWPSYQQNSKIRMHFHVVQASAIQQYLGIKTLLPTFSVTHHMILSKTIGEPAPTTALSSNLPGFSSIFHSTPTGPLSPFGDRMTFEERLINTVSDSALRLLVQRPRITSFEYPYSVIDLEVESSLIYNKIMRCSGSRDEIIFRLLELQPIFGFPTTNSHKNSTDRRNRCECDKVEKGKVAKRARWSSESSEENDSDFVRISDVLERYAQPL